MNISAIKKHALRCSATYRANKFTRVGQDFLDEIATDMETIVREFTYKGETLHPALPAEGEFVTGELMEKLREALNGYIARLIQNKIQKQPSCGCTAGRTR